MVRSATRAGSWHLAVAFAVFAGPVAAPGCGSSGIGTTRGVPGASKYVNKEDMYHYEGKGRNKRKVAVSRRERVRLLREAGEKVGTP
jgi:hypothetical protein